MATVTIGCKLPNGIQLIVRKPRMGRVHGGGEGIIGSDIEGSVMLKGINQSLIEGAGVAYTDVDEAFWTRWKKEHASWFVPFTSGAIFEEKADDVASKIAATSEKKGEVSGYQGLHVNGKTGAIDDPRAQAGKVKMDDEAPSAAAFR
jgi:hypothetical protein